MGSKPHTAILGCGVAIAALSLASAVQAQQRRNFDIPSEAAAKAIPEFARQAGMQILAPVGQLHGVMAPAVKGALEIHEALRRLLAGTSLEIATDNGATIILRPKAEASDCEVFLPCLRRNQDGRASRALSGCDWRRQGASGDHMHIRTYKTVLACGAAVAAFVGASVAQAQQQALTDQSTVKPDFALPEVIVTANKRPEAVRKISASVTAVTGAQTEALGANSLADYLTFVPGVILNAAIPGQSPVVIRGVSTTVGLDQGQGTTGYFINDVPLTDPYFNVSIPDIDAFDVDNVTVLKGPQGTLFGSASLGGAVDYQAAKPNLTQYQARVQGTVDGVDGGGTGGSGKVMINLPLLPDTLAVRGVYVYRDDAGFIDNIGTGVKNSNETLTRGGRIEATWTPTSKTTVNYLFLDQTEDTKDLGYQEPVGAGSLEKKTLIPEPNDYLTRINSLRVDQDLGFATLTATATYHEKTQSFGEDATGELGALLPGAGAVDNKEIGDSRGSTFEVRLASPTGQRLEYVVGAFYDITRENFVETLSAPNAAASIQATYGGLLGPSIGATGAPGNVFLTAALPFKGKETAVFGEATFHLNDQWKVTFGGREFETQSSNVETTSGFFELLEVGSLSTTLKGSQDESGFTPKGSITWTPNHNILAYGLISKGFRFGGPNINVSTPADPIPATFGSDSLINYELGTRTNWFGDRLQLDATVFYIDWSNIQLRLDTPSGLGYAANAGKATNYGFESTGTWRIVPGLTFQANLSYLEAKLDDNFNPGAGQPIIPKGSTLPGASKWQVSDTLSYTWAEGPFTPTFLVTHRFISDAPGNFSGGVPQGNYNLVDGRITGHFKTLDVSVFVKNIGDSHGVTSGSNFSAEGIPLAQYIVTPRTVGITFDYKM